MRGRISQLLTWRVTTNKYDVFISYRTDESQDVARQIANSLRRARHPILKRNLKIFLDKEQIQPGQNIDVELRQAITSSTCFIVLLTPSYTKSMYTAFEHVLISSIDPSSLKERIIPIMVKTCPLPASLASISYLDFRTEMQDPILRAQSLMDEEKELLTTLDHILDLLRDRLIFGQHRFKQELERLFTEMTILHDDYRTAFHTLLPEFWQESYEKGKHHTEGYRNNSPVADATQLEMIQSKVMAKKFRLQPLRDKVRAVIDAFLESGRFTDNNEVQRFLRECASYLCVEGQSGFSRALSHLEVLSLIETPWNLHEYFSEVIIELDRSWQSLVRSYAKLKVTDLE